MKLINLNCQLRLFGQDFLKMLNWIQLASLLYFPSRALHCPSFLTFKKMFLLFVNKVCCLLGKEFLVPRLSPMLYLGNLL